MTSVARTWPDSLSCLCSAPTSPASPRRLMSTDPTPSARNLPARLRALGVGSVDIRRRGLAGDVDKLHQQLKLSGSLRATLVMTRVQDRPWGLVCVDV